jgi:acyl carrier protein
MMSHDDVIAAARGFVMQNFLYTRPHAVLEPEEPLLGAGIIDSMGVIELVDWISSTYGIYVEDDEITEENLGSLGSIARYVAGKRGARVAA